MHRVNRKERKDKAQSAIEYLTTYGWAILVIMIVFGVLYYFGIFGGGPGISGSCIAQQGFLCTNPVFSSNGNLTVTVGYTGGGFVTVTGAACTANMSGSVNIISVNSIKLQSGNQAPLTFQCPLSGGIGTKFNGYIWIAYTNGIQSGLLAEVGIVSGQVTKYVPPISYSSIFASISPSSQSLYQGSIAAINTISISGGKFPYTYQWYATTAGSNSFSASEANVLLGTGNTIGKAQSPNAIWTTSGSTTFGLYQFELYIIDSETPANVIFTGSANVLINGLYPISLSMNANPSADPPAVSITATCGNSDSCAVEFPTGTVVATGTGTATYSTSTSLSPGNYIVSANDLTSGLGVSNTLQITASSPTCYSLLLYGSPSTSGSESANAASSGGCSTGNYISGTQLTLTATPSAGSTFSSWSGTSTGSTNTLSITITNPAAETAQYSTCTSGTNSMTITSYQTISVTRAASISYELIGGGGGGGSDGSTGVTTTGGSAGSTTFGIFTASAGDSLSAYPGAGGGGGGGGGNGYPTGAGGGGGAGYYGGGGGSGGSYNNYPYWGGTGAGGGSSALLDNSALVNGNAYAAGGAGGNNGAYGGGSGGSNSGGAGASGYSTGSNGGSTYGGSGGYSEYSAGGGGGGSGSSAGSGGGAGTNGGDGGGGGGAYGGVGGAGGNGGNTAGSGGGSSGSGSGTGSGGYAGTASNAGGGGNGGSVVISWTGSSCVI